MEYKNDLTLHDYNYYLDIANSSIKYYKDVIKEFNKDKFYLGLFMAIQFKDIINKKNEEAIDIFYNALKSYLGKQGTQWDNLFFAFENWKYNYFDNNK